MPTLSDAAVQSRLTLGDVSADAVNEPGVPGFTLSMTCTFTPLASDDSVLIEMPDTGSVKRLADEERRVLEVGRGWRRVDEVARVVPGVREAERDAGDGRRTGGERVEGAVGHPVVHRERRGVAARDAEDLHGPAAEVGRDGVGVADRPGDRLGRADEAELVQLRPVVVAQGVVAHRGERVLVAPWTVHEEVGGDRDPGPELLVQLSAFAWPRPQLWPSSCVVTWTL